jgi:hypothetical protein
VAQGRLGAPEIKERTSIADLTGRSEAGLRVWALVVSLILIVEYFVGASVNLYVTIPTADHGASDLPAIGQAISNGPAGLAIHAVLGLLLIVGALALVARAIRTRRRPVAALTLVGLLSLIGAALSGAEFVGKQENGASMSVAALTGVALICYMLIIYFTSGAKAPR